MKKSHHIALASFLFLLLTLQLPAQSQTPPMGMETPVTEGISGGIQINSIQSFTQYHRASSQRITLPYNIYPNWQAGVTFSYNTFQVQEQERLSEFNPPAIFTKVQFYRKEIKNKSFRLAYKYSHFFASDERPWMGNNSLLAAWIAPRYALYTEIGSGFSAQRPFEYFSTNLSAVVPVLAPQANVRQLSLSAGVGSYFMSETKDLSYTGTLGLQYQHSRRFMMEAGSSVPISAPGSLYRTYSVALNVGIRFLLY